MRMDFEVIILRKLIRHRIIGGKHTAIENITKGIPKNLVGEAKNQVKKLAKEGVLIDSFELPLKRGRWNTKLSLRILGI